VRAEPSPWRSRTHVGPLAVLLQPQDGYENARADRRHPRQRSPDRQPDPYCLVSLSPRQKPMLEDSVPAGNRNHVSVVDESAAAMTERNARKDTTDILKRASQDLRAVILVEHDMESLRRLDCKFTVLHEGSVSGRSSLTNR